MQSFYDQSSVDVHILAYQMRSFTILVIRHQLVDIRALKRGFSRNAIFLRCKKAVELSTWIFNPVTRSDLEDTPNLYSAIETVWLHFVDLLCDRRGYFFCDSHFDLG